MFKFLRDRSIINRIIIINAVLSVCIIAFLVFNNLYIKDELNKRTYENYRTLLEEFQGKFFVEMNRIKNVSTLMLNETELTNIKKYVPNSAAQIKSIGELKKQCSFISRFFDYSSSVSIHLVNKNMIINENGSVDSEYFNIRINDNNNFFKNDKINYNELDIGFHSLQSNILYVTKTFKDTNVYFAVSKDAFISFLESSTRNNDGCFSVYLDGESLMSSENFPITWDYKELQQTNTLSYKNADGKKYGIITENRDFFGRPITFVYAYAFNQYEQIAQYVNLYTWFSIFIFLFINIIAIFIQYIIYAPIKKIASDFHNSNSGKNEVHLIQNAVDHLRKDNAVMQDVIKRNESVYEGLALLKLMIGEKEAFDPKILKNLSLKFNHYIMIYIVQSNNFSLISEITEAIAKEYYIERVFTDAESKRYVINCSGRNPVIEIILKIIRIHSAKKDVIIGVSSEFNDINELDTAYIESNQAIYQATVSALMSSNILIYKDSEFKSDFFISREREQEIINAVISGNSEHIEQFFDEFLCSKFEIMNYRNFKRLYSHLLSVLCSIMNTKNINETNTKNIDDEFFVRNIHHYVKECYLNVTCLCSNNTKSMYKMIIEYINANTDKCITVNSIAYSLKITPEYLSSYFKNSNGLNISTYINNVKMERAKELLRSDKNIKISAVAEKVGIDQVNTFNRKFKKYTGITPSQYKQNF